VGWDFARRVPDELFEVTVEEIEVMDSTFLDQFGGKAEVKIKLQQSRFYIKSHGFQVRDDMHISTEQFTFIIDRLNAYDYQEVSQLFHKASRNSK